MHNRFNQLKNIEVVLFDFKGILLHSVENNDQEIISRLYDALKKFCQNAEKLKIKTGIITSTENNELLNRLKSGGFIEVMNGSIDKVSLAEILIFKLQVDYSKVFYIGDDLLDLPLLQKVGFSASLKKARREVKRVVDFIYPGANGIELLDEIWQDLEKAKNI